MKNRNILIAAAVLIILVFGYFKFVKTEPAKIYRVGDLMLQVSLSPNPPRVGDVKLKIIPIDNQNVEAIDIGYGMPAMGNMPAMRSEVSGQKSGDSYEALLSVSMLGTWDLTLDIKTKDGKSKKANFKFSTGQKGLSYYPDEEPAPISMSSDVQTIKLTSKQIKLAEVSSAPLKKLAIYRSIRAAGVVAYDPDLNIAEQEYLLEEENRELVLNKLKLLGISKHELAVLDKTQKPDEALILPSDRAWIYADVYEYEIQEVKAGQGVQISSVAYPETEFYGIVRSIVPVLDSKTRSNRVRIEVLNASGKLNPNMYVDAIFNIPLGSKPAIPKAAALITGKEQLVYVDHGSGYYERRSPKLGSLAYTQTNLPVYPVISGIKEGELVVGEANFLLDSQSELSGGMSGLYGSSAKEVKKHDQQSH
ncbi:hypothetical protein A2276_02040 [candidate division WOR-1 bacterium RIFOXYA12_FULL_43_27]|uniref:CusB-like beta-barrel domain-containing protein n=1 Tax=candidate division WOR-1 bacterium RIFOXYC2_FULL_46_14 TaxID=1802587 RepID=A0A1F4U8E1_UNCSA|nr:MAG: hypothetical protein A2276_02040 [candidate division WOR-1 bacterium RIFOXYA12_FULL_43_27]OGC19497.1 MAG: hypothetical protein A2292_02290 [candidate division WOR-1 bacterium RIFOXYB2_FULL_46_45]OGC30485.1 MAG: hypothetical protein A2232_02290 [candidate division WOR-1 bacterium RIFOXYA2_FULL_46_56]OGC40553.1 MAG: hypothetical protein A2438_06005 [candidate division WOR-1 bacterium RIFOXYC2_FULL_46_14]